MTDQEQLEQQGEPIELPPLNPNNLLARVERYNPDLYGRIIAEEQRDQLAKMVQQLSQQHPSTEPEIANKAEHTLDLNESKDAA